MKIFSYFLCVILFTSCGNRDKNKTEEENDSLDGEFKITAIKEKNVDTEELFLEFVPQETIVFGNTGCNGFSSRFVLDKKELSFNAPVSTKKFCEGKMKTEQQLFSALEETSKFDWDGKQLILFSEENNPLIILIKTNSREQY